MLSEQPANENKLRVGIPLPRVKELLAAYRRTDTDSINIDLERDQVISDMLEIVKRAFIMYAAASNVTRSGGDFRIERAISPEERGRVISITGRRKETIELSIFSRETDQAEMKLRSAAEETTTKSSNEKAHLEIWIPWMLVQSLLKANLGVEADFSDLQREEVQLKVKQIIDDAFEIFTEAHRAIEEGLNTYLLTPTGQRVPIFSYG